jgi:hypothetical protein
VVGNERITMTNTTIIRERPDAKMPFLRFQVGYMESRPMQNPLFVGKSIDSYYLAGSDRVFHLLGFGETLDLAEKMAGVKALEIEGGALL